MLIDTGSSQTILSYSSYLLIPELKRPRLEPALVTATMADGAPLEMWGTAWVEIHVGNVSQTINLMVANIKVEGIIGMDFLISTGSSLDCSNLQLQLKGEKVKCKSSTGELFCARLVVTETTVVLPGHERLIPTEIKGKMWKGKELGLVEPLEISPLPKHEIMIARSVVNVTNTMCVQVCNLGQQRRKVKAGTVIACLSPLDPSDIHSRQQVAVANGVSGESVTMVDATEDPIEEQIVPEYLQELYTESVHDLSEKDSKQVQGLLCQYSDVFSKSEDDIGRTSLVKHTIDTGDARPVKQRPRRFPPVQQAEIDRQVKGLLEKGLISPSTSPWSSQVTLAAKKGGKFRLCCDLRKVNELTKKDSYPLPRIDETLDALAKSNKYCVLDLRAGYWQIELDESAREKCSFAVKSGFYTWNVMPFGLCNAPATFERLMERVLSGLHWETLLVYLDDVIVFGSSVPETITRLETVLQRLRAAGLKLAPNKCHLFQTEVQYLGHVVTPNGVKTQPEKVQTVKEWPTPQCVTEVRSFVGLVSYYRRFIPNMSKIAKPLYGLYDKSVEFLWTVECELAFQKLKECLITAPVLAYPQSEGQYIIDCDASNYAMGGVLSQEQDGVVRVIAYGSKTFSKAERNYCVTRRELLAVVYFLKYFRHYVYGRKVIVRTDHSALKWLVNFKMPEGQLARWLEIVSGYNIELIHRPGVKHGNADALSRRPCKQCGRKDERKYEETNQMKQGMEQIRDLGQVTTEKLWSKLPPNCDMNQEWEEFSSESLKSINTVTVTPVITLEEIREAQLTEPSMSSLLIALEKGVVRPEWNEVSPCVPDLKVYWAQWDMLCVKDGVLCRRWIHPNRGEEMLKVMLPPAMHKLVLEQCHNVKAAGHLGQKKTLHRLQEKYYWVRMIQDVRSWLRQCTGCAKRKSPPKRRRAPLRQYRVGGPLERVALDILGPLPVTESGNKYVLVIGDYFTKWMEAIPIPDQTAVTVAKAFVGEFVCRYGMPLELHSDQGSNFMSQVFTESLRVLGITQTRTCGYNPKSDGMIERYNRTLLSIVSLLIEPYKNQKDWDTQLPYVGYAYRSAVQESTGETPNMLMLGREVGTPLDLLVENVQDDKEVTDFALDLRERFRSAHDRARKVLKASARRQKRQYDRKARASNIKQGDFVWVFNNQRKVGVCSKLRLPWTGPELVVEKLSDVHCKIQKGPKSRCKIIHMDRLKPYEGTEHKSWLECQVHEEGKPMSNQSGDSVDVPKDGRINIEDPIGLSVTPEVEQTSSLNNSASVEDGNEVKVDEPTVRAHVKNDTGNKELLEVPAVSGRRNPRRRRKLPARFR